MPTIKCKQVKIRRGCVESRCIIDALSLDYRL